MTVHIDKGWLNVSQGGDSMRVYFETVKVDTKNEPTISHYPFRSHLFYTTQKRWEVFKFKNVSFDNHTEFSLFIDIIWDWQAIGTFTLKVERDDIGTGIEWDGDNQTYEVAIPKGGVRGKEKIAPDDGGPYQIGMLILEQAG